MEEQRAVENSFSIKRSGNHSNKTIIHATDLQHAAAQTACSNDGCENKDSL
jgi:hypothetical protein